MYDGIKVLQARIVPGGVIITLADGRTLYSSRTTPSPA